MCKVPACHGMTLYEVMCESLYKLYLCTNYVTNYYYVHTPSHPPLCGPMRVTRVCENIPRTYPRPVCRVFIRRGGLWRDGRVGHWPPSSWIKIKSGRTSLAGLGPQGLSVVTETPGKRPGSLETIADGKTAAQGLLA